MRKRKIFVKTDLATPEVEHSINPETGEQCIDKQRIPPPITQVRFQDNSGGEETFNFAPHYAVGIDEITYVCQRQVERFLDGQDHDLESATVQGYCNSGLRLFLMFATALSAALKRPLRVTDVNRSMMDEYLAFLRSSGRAVRSQRTAYYYTKAVLTALGRRGIITVLEFGEQMTFPKNAFSNSHRAESSAALPISITERNAFAIAIKHATRGIFEMAEAPDRRTLTSALFLIALHTGRNTTPLLEMSIDCLRPHPKDGVEFLILTKRRGHSTSKVALRAESKVSRTVEAQPTVRTQVSRLIRKITDLTAPLRQEAPPYLQKRLWLFRTESGIKALRDKHLSQDMSTFVKRNQLKDSTGQPLRVNVSRLRKTFTNRIYELVDGDLVATSAAAGNQPKVTDEYYLSPSPESTRNWRFMGACLVNELLTNTVGATERTPVGRCTDSKFGEYAPKAEGRLCQSFMNCLRCRNYVVTGDDLWRLFSFYWRVLKERSNAGRKRWNKHLAHIPRLIDRDIVGGGLERKIFTQRQIEEARERARLEPHPFWADHEIITQLEQIDE